MYRERENPLNDPGARFEPTKIGYVSDLCSERAGQESQIGSLFMTLGRIVVAVSCELWRMKMWNEKNMLDPNMLNGVKFTISFDLL